VDRGMGSVAIPFVVVSRGAENEQTSFGGGVIDSMA